MLLVSFMLALSISVPMEQFSSAEADELGYALMEAVEAEPAKCPIALAEDTILSVMFCGAIPIGFVQNESAIARVIDETMNHAGATLRTEWEGDGRLRSKKYNLDDIPLKIIINRRKGLVVLRYPAQFPDCLDSELPQSYPEGDGISIPEMIRKNRIKVTYPELARQARLESVVVLQAVVTREGSIGDVCVTYSKLKNLGFEQAAIDAVSQWRYKPAIKNGEPVDVRLNINVSFILH